MTLRAARLSGLGEDREGKADFRMKALGSDWRRLEASRGAPEVELDHEIYLSFCRTAQQRLRANNVTMGLTAEDRRRSREGKSLHIFCHSESKVTIYIYFNVGVTLYK